MLENLFGGKSWYKSLTAWGVIVFIVVTSAIDQVCAAGVASDSLCATLTTWSETIGAVLVTLGIRKAATAPNSG